MDSARREMDRLAYEAWGTLASDVKKTSRSMGRVGLSYARRHPALLLGGGALLGAAAVAWFTREKKTKPTAQPVIAGAALAPGAQASSPAAKAPNAMMDAVTTILKNVARVWLVNMLASEFRVEKAVEGEKNGEAARENPVCAA